MRLLIAVAVIFALVAFLNWQFPYALQSTDDKMQIVYSVGLLALVGSGFLFSREFSGSYMLKTSFIWICIFVVLILGYSYRDVFMNNRLMAELVPHRARVSSDGVITVRSGEDGHFHIEMAVNNTPVKFMVDTGASNIVLSPRDAQRTGFDTATLNYSRIFSTANGIGKGAPVRLESLRVGKVELRNVPASVNGADMRQSLLGMDFLKLMKSYQVEGNTLTLVP